LLTRSGHEEHDAAEPLLISQLRRYGTTLHADQEVVTWTGDASGEGDTARSAPVLQAAGALPGLGVTGDQRAATFIWNNAKHLIANLAIPSMGAALNTPNIGLLPE
jgi:fatty-acyl-CoA synthase